MHWFVRKGLFFKPSSLVGWGLLTCTLAYCVLAFIEVDKHSHSVSDTLINWLFRVILVGLVYSIIAYFTSPKE
ncbi:hypothetical protein GVN20_00370 [Runella sp. CRIBMP]|uniref:hypothetical protein n=1 Tax=Runella TaxID=105 RepID=UPI0011C043C7|nr:MULTISPECIES: hypothetical protein [Runella]NBB17794.1 hypothetical protein [Runella sp. CRIBMP]